MRVKQALEAAKKRDPNDPITKAFLDFPFKPREDGGCEMLDENNNCTIYNNRPLICNIENLYEKAVKGAKTKKEYFLENAEACNRMIKEEGYPEEYLVDTIQYK